MSEQDGKQASSLKRPLTTNPKEWKAYWQQQGQSWRTWPEIGTERQEFLAERRLLSPNIEQGIYPFKDIKLTRADIEWLLWTHESGGICGPVDCSDERQRERNGLDVQTSPRMVYKSGQ